MKDRTLISFDYAIKYLLKDKQDYEIVEGFISAVLGSQGYSPVKIIALLESESNKELPELKRSIADLIVKDREGRQYVVEIDHEQSDFFLKKACFNTCRLVVDSIREGQEYSEIEKIFHISLLYFPFIGTSAPLHHGKVIFHEVEQDKTQQLELSSAHQKHQQIYDVFPEYFVISVPAFNDVISQELDEWLYMMKHSAVREDFKSPYMKKVAQRLNMLKMTDIERVKYDRYMNRSRKERDYLVTATRIGLEEGEEIGLQKGLRKGKAMGLEEGKALGLEEGTALGLEKGLEEGAKQKARTIALNLLQQGLTLDAVVMATGLSLKEVQVIDSR